MSSTATRQAGDDVAMEETSFWKRRARSYGEAACPVEVVFLAFRLKAPGRFFGPHATQIGDFDLYDGLERKCGGSSH